jgi:phosphatidylinositol alpha-mannosyltransferase
MVLAPAARGKDLHPPGGVTLVGRAISLPANGSMAPVAFGPVAAARIKRILESWAPDVVHLHEPLIPSLSLLALRSAAAPTIGTFHAAAEDSLGYRVSRPALSRAFDRLDVVTAVSESARALVERYFPGEYHLTPNGVEVARFAEARPADHGARPIVLFFGRLERRKGLEVLIQAMTRLRDLDSLLVVVGGGPQQRPCRGLARRLQVDVRWIGAVHEDLKPSTFASADVYCAPALGGESFGIVLIEAMAAGTPVVCSDLPGFRAVVDGAGVLTAPGDPGRLADGLRRVLTRSDEAKRMSVEGARVAEQFDWDRLAGGVEAIYRRAIEGA